MTTTPVSPRSLSNARAETEWKIHARVLMGNHQFRTLVNYIHLLFSPSGPAHRRFQGTPPKIDS